MKNKTTFLPPPSNQIIYEEPKELYLIDITDIPHEFIEKKNKLYILSILDHFSKFSANFIIKNKDKISVLNKIKKFIEKYGAPDKILTDNGGEFINNEFKKFCKKLHI